MDGLPEFAFTRIIEFFAGPRPGVGRQAIEVTRRAADGTWVLPLGFQPVESCKAHEDGIERAGSEFGLLAEGIAVMPMSGLCKQGFQKQERLRGDTNAASHVHKST